MTNKKMIGFSGIFCILLTMLFGFNMLFLLYAESASAAGPIKLKWVSFRPATHKGVIGIKNSFVEPINKKAKGELIIEWKGGPDTMAPRDIGLAVQRGTIDIGSIYVGAYEALVPGVGGSMLTQLTPQEERKPGGAYDYLQSLHKKARIFFLGRPEAMSGAFFYTWLRNKKIQNKKDFVGMKIGSATSARAAVSAWGATHVTVAVPENYSALERGLVEGIGGQPLRGAVGFGWYERAKYVIDHPYYQSTVVLIMNLKTWNKLPGHLQDMIMSSFIEGEKNAMGMQGQTEQALRTKIAKSGVEFYKLSPDMADWYLKTAYESAWAYQQKRFPDVTPKLKQLLSK